MPDCLLSLQSLDCCHALQLDQLGQLRSQQDLTDAQLAELNALHRLPKISEASARTLLGPLAAVACGHSSADAIGIIRMHLIGMFAPSFVTGNLIARFGVTRILLAGAGMLLASALTALSGTSLYNFWAALALLGVGWNFLYVGGTTLLTSAYRPEERAKTAIIGENFGEAGAIDLLGKKYGLPHALSGHQNNWYWGPPDWEPESYIIVGREAEGESKHFRDVQVFAELNNPYASVWERGPVLICRHRTFGSLKDVWPMMKKWR